MDFETFYSSSAGNLYRLSADGCPQLLLECGVPIRQIRQALDFQLSDIEACLVTHSHQDHCKAAKDLLRNGTDLYATEETVHAIGVGEETLRLPYFLEPLKTVKIGPWSVLPFETEHDTPGSVGFLISNGKDKLLFATDTFYIRYKFKALTHICIECNYSIETLSPDLNPSAKERLTRSHFSLANVKTFLLANDLSCVKEIHLLHLSRGNSDAEYFKAEIEKTTGRPVYVAQEKPCAS